jgi:DNA topoisomerase III
VGTGDGTPTSKKADTDEAARRTIRRAHEARPPGRRPSGFTPVTLGPCSLCGSEIVDRAKSYQSSGWQSGCKFVIWKTIAGKRITLRTAQTLVK